MVLWSFLTTNPYLFMLHNLILYYSQFFNSQGEFGFWIWTHDDVWVAFFCTFVLEITMDECMHNGDTWSQTIIFILTNLSNLTSDFFPRILEFQKLHLCWWRMLVADVGDRCWWLSITSNPFYSVWKNYQNED